MRNKTDNYHYNSPEGGMNIYDTYSIWDLKYIYRILLKRIYEK